MGEDRAESAAFASTLACECFARARARAFEGSGVGAGRWRRVLVRAASLAGEMLGPGHAGDVDRGVVGELLLLNSLLAKK